MQVDSSGPPAVCPVKIGRDRRRLRRSSRVFVGGSDIHSQPGETGCSFPVWPLGERFLRRPFLAQIRPQLSLVAVSGLRHLSQQNLRILQRHIATNHAQYSHWTIGR